MTALPLTSRFQIVERPVAHPGKCAVCGATDRECVDFGMDLEDYGAVYFCVECAQEVGLAVGLVTAETLAKATIEAGQSIDAYLNGANAKVVTNELHAALHTVVNLVLDGHGNSHVHSAAEGMVSVGQEDADAGNAAPVEQSDSNVSDEPADNSSGQSDGAASKRRSASVPASSSNESLGLGF